MVFLTSSVTIDITLTAKWRQAYTLPVVSGTDNTGASPNTAAATVSITANTAPAGQVFDHWTTDNSGSFADASSASTTFTMPAGNVTVTANYANAFTTQTLTDSATGSTVTVC